MKKLLLALVCLACGAVSARAQNTIAVSASNIQGINGTKLVSGSLCFQGTDQNDKVIAFQVGGGGAVVTSPFCTSVTNGVISSFNVPNPANTSPINVRYRITVLQGARTVLNSPGAYLCNATGACTSPYTFNFDNCFSSLACIANPVPIASGPQGPTGAAGAAGPTGPPGTATSNTGMTVGGNAILKGPNPHRDVTYYGASGSTRTTTTGASFTSGSTTLTLTAALDFQNGHQVRIVGPGAVSVLSSPAGLAVTPCNVSACPGGTGATTYQYQVATIDAEWGTTIASTAVSIANGNATLSYTNFNKSTWSAATSGVYYAVYGRTSGSMTLLGCTPNLFWADYGQTSTTCPSTVPSTPPVAAQKGFYYGIITAGGGTTSLTMDTASGATTGSGATVEHDDSAGWQAAMNAATAPITGMANGTQDRIYCPPGNYNITQPLIPNANPFMQFRGSNGFSCNLLTHVPGMDLFLINNDNDAVSWRDLKISLSGDSTAVHYSANAPEALEAHISHVQVSGTSGSGMGTTFFRTDANTIVLNIDHSHSVTDVQLRFGEPGNPVQIDDVHVSQSFLGTGTNTNIAGTYQFVNNGSSGLVVFRDTLIEGPIPSGSSIPWFRLANIVPISFRDVEWAPEDTSAGTGAAFQAWPGMAVGAGPLTFDSTPISSIGTGGIFDFSAGTPASSNPVIVLRESSATAAGGAQVFHAATDSTGLSCHNSRLSPTQTLLGFHVEAIKCFGVANFTNNSNQLYFRGYPGADQDQVAFDDSNGNTNFHIGPNGALGGTITVGTLPAAAAGNKGQVRTVSDSTAVATEGQTCVGGSSNTALAFSNGSTWKCF